jgi:hypothetical protein
LEDEGMEAKSVSGATPPQHPVSIVSTEANHSGYYYKIDSPETTFGDTWGDVDSMQRRLTDKEVEEISTGNIGFWVVTGVNW